MALNAIPIQANVISVHLLVIEAATEEGALSHAG